MPRICVVSDCGRPRHAHGFCTKHLRRWETHGDPSIVACPQKGDHMRWLEAHVSYSSDDCLTWPFARNPDGRGVAYWNCKPTGAHRQMCILAHGAPPSPKHFASHICGKGHRGCVNPRHLAWETQKQNLARRKDHGTDQTGDRHPTAKLNTMNVLEIRRLKAEGSLNVEQAARTFKVTPGTILDVARGKSWKHVSL